MDSVMEPFLAVALRHSGFPTCVRRLLEAVSSGTALLSQPLIPSPLLFTCTTCALLAAPGLKG